MAFFEGRNSDMFVEIYRIKGAWQNRGGEYAYEVVPSKFQFIYIDTVTWLFFGFSALMHGVWVVLGPFDFFKSFLWDQLDNCLCWWRWFEYSFSASLMLVGIAIVTGIRDQNTVCATDDVR